MTFTPDMYNACTSRRGGGEALILGEANALGVDFTHPDRMRQLRITTSGVAVDSAPYDTFTYTSPSIKVAQQADGLYRYVNHNLAIQSQTFDSASWTKTRTAASANSTTAPDGTVTADTITCTATTGNHIAFLTMTNPGASFVLTYSVWVKKNTHRYVYLNNQSSTSTHYATAVFDLDGGGTSSTETSVGSGSGTVVSASMAAVGNGWYRLSMAASTTTASNWHFPVIGFANAATGNTFDNFGTVSFTAAGTEAIYLWGAQLKFTPVNDAGGYDYLGGYLVTTTVAKYDMPYAWSSGVPQGILVEVRRVNICLWSEDLTNAAWTKTNMTTAYTSNGLAGDANRATRCTATGANATALQAITSASHNRIASMFVKRITGSGNIDMTQDNGSTWTTVTTTSAWTQVSLANQTLTNPTVGIRIVTSGDAVDIAYFNAHTGDNNATTQTSPIWTTTLSYTRLKDQISILNASYPAITNTGSCHSVHTGRAFNSLVTNAPWTSYDTGVSVYGIDTYGDASSSGNWRLGAWDNSVLGMNLNSGVAIAAGTTKLAAAWTSGSQSIAVNGTLATLGSATPPTVLTTTLFGTTFNNQGEINDNLQKVALIGGRRMADAELTAWTS